MASSVGSILKGFRKVVTKLETLAKKEKEKIDSKKLQRDELQVQIGTHQSEVIKAESIAAKIKQLLS
ncbi:MAG: hypothetical protein BA874_03750 [Desulfuromonadales bacterium C00003068]|jgi:hypothetical protein|nr:MAG: hypothetical protein BA874_03750 [Desulfuromonadales bacterium C00003068]